MLIASAEFCFFFFEAICVMILNNNYTFMIIIAKQDKDHLQLIPNRKQKVRRRCDLESRPVAIEKTSQYM